MLKKIYWFMVRSFFLFFALIGLLSGGLLVFPFGPVYSWYFKGDFNYLKYRRYTFRVMLSGYKMLSDWLFSPEYMRVFIPSMTAPPMMKPDLSKVAISKNWEGPKDSCGGCSKCCTKRECPLFDLSSEACLSYGSFFWRYFNCGRYPENAEQIGYYECPKWVV